MPKGSTIFRILLAASAAVFPIMFAHEIEARHWLFLVMFSALAISVAGVEIYFDWKRATERDRIQRNFEVEIKRQRDRLVIQEARGVTMARLIELLKPVFGIIGNVSLFSDDEKKSAVKSLDDANSEMLKGTCGEVKAYYSEYKDLRVSASVLLAYPIDGTSPEVKQHINNDFILITISSNLAAIFLHTIVCWT